MKSQFVKISIGSFLFIAMIFAILVFFQPLCQRFENRLIQYRDSLLQQMEDQTGLRVSYQSLSPSILSAFRIKGIVSLLLSGNVGSNIGASSGNTNAQIKSDILI